MNRFCFNQAGMVVIVAVLLAACRPAAVQAPAPPAAHAPVADGTPAPTVGDASPAPAAVPVAEPADEQEWAVDQRIDRLLGDHRRYRQVIQDYQRAVAAGDREAVAALVRYPLKATVDGRKVVIADPQAFIAAYDKIITPRIARVVTTQRYAQLLVNYQGVMFGNGETWIAGICAPASADCSQFQVKVITIQ